MSATTSLLNLPCAESDLTSTASIKERCDPTPAGISAGLYLPVRVHVNITLTAQTYAMFIIILHVTGEWIFTEATNPCSAGLSHHALPISWSNSSLLNMIVVKRPESLPKIAQPSLFTADTP